MIERDDVDFFVGRVESDAAGSDATARFIEEYKNRPDYQIEAEEAERILAALEEPARDCRGGRSGCGEAGFDSGEEDTDENPSAAPRLAPLRVA